MKKRLTLYIVLIVCLLVLPGCRQNKENRANMELFREGFKQLQELTSLHLRIDRYHGVELYSSKNEWRSGEDFYWTSTSETRCLSYGGNYWSYDFPSHTEWEKKVRPVESLSTWWNNYEADDFLAGYITFRREGEFIVLEQTVDQGSDNCTLSRQVSTNTFYMTEAGEVVQITRSTVTYSGPDANPEQVYSVRRDEYYITPMDAVEVEKKIQQQYQFVME